MMGGQRRQRLFLLAEPRSGSSWLMETLDSHPDIQLLGERLNHAQFPEIKAFCGGGEKKFRECLEHLEAVLGAFAEPKARFIGCKVLLNQLTFIGEGFADHFLDRYRDAAFVFLYRRNLVAGQISLRLAHQYDAWHAKRSSQVVLKKITLPPSVLVANLESSLCRREEIRLALKARDARCQSLSYEELFADPAQALAGILAFLGLGEKKLAFSSEMKGNPFRPQDVIENYREVSDHLQRYPHFLRMLADA